MKRTIVAALAALSLLGGIATAEFRPRPADASLRDTERAYACVGVETGWYPSHVVGNRRYRVEANTVTDVTDPDEAKHRRVSVSADYHLRWIGAADGIAFLVADSSTAKLGPNAPRPYRQFHRLDLDSMKWLEPFELPEPSSDRYGGGAVHIGDSAPQKPQLHVLPIDLLLTPEGVVVLCEETLEQQDAFGPESVGYHVSCYPPQDIEAKWDRFIRQGKRARQSVAYNLWSSDDSIQRLSYFSGRSDEGLILACLGEHDAVVCLAAIDGEVYWRIPAIWEYERGLGGPEYYIERFGLDYVTAQTAYDPILLNDEEEIDRKELRLKIREKMQARRKLDASRKAFYARYQGRITAGPIVVPDGDGRGNPVVYVAAARSLKPEPGWIEQPEHYVLYEIDPQYGDLTSMARLPRAVTGWPYRDVHGGVVLSCDRGSMVRLRTYEPEFGGISRPGSATDDLVLQFDWYRDYLMRCPPSWFIAEPPTDVAGFSKLRLFRPGMAYVRTADANVYSLQINVADLRTGLDHDMTLSVPYDGELPIPETGLASLNRGTSTERLQATGPHAVWINSISVNDDQLIIAVAHGSERTALTFDLSEMLADE